MAKFITDSQHNKGRGDIRDFMVFVDEPEEQGGTDRDPTPTEYLLLALASCMAITMKMYAERKEWNTGLIEVECNFTTNTTGEKSITKKIHFQNAISNEQEERLLLISTKCPVTKMIALPIELIR